MWGRSGSRTPRNWPYLHTGQSRRGHRVACKGLVRIYVLHYQVITCTHVVRHKQHVYMYIGRDVPTVVGNGCVRTALENRRPCSTCTLPTTTIRTCTVIWLYFTLKIFRTLLFRVVLISYAPHIVYETRVKITLLNNIRSFNFRTYGSIRN